MKLEWTFGVLEMFWVDVWVEGSYQGQRVRQCEGQAESSPVHDSPPWGRESWIWRTLVVEIPLKSSFVSPLQELLYLLSPPILLDDHVDDKSMSNFMSCVMQDVIIHLWRTPGFLWHRFPLHHPVGLPLPTVPEWMMYTVLRPCNTPESMISPVYHHPVGRFGSARLDGEHYTRTLRQSGAPKTLMEPKPAFKTHFFQLILEDNSVFKVLV